MRDAAMSSIAFVIFFVDCTDLIRRRYSRSWAPIRSALRLGLRLGALVGRDRLLALVARLHRVDLLVLHQRLAGGGVERLLEVADGLLEGLNRLIRQLAGRGDRVVDALVPVVDVVEELTLEAAYVGNRHLVELAGGAGPHRDDLALDGERGVLRLLEQLDETGTALELRLRRLVEVGTEGRERLQLAVLREVEPQTTGDGLHRLDLRVAADSRHRDADVDRGTHTGVEQVGLEEDLAVGD